MMFKGGPKDKDYKRMIFGVDIVQAEASATNKMLKELKA